MVRTPRFLLLRAQVQFLVGELRSRKLWSGQKSKKPKERKKRRLGPGQGEGHKKTTRKRGTLKEINPADTLISDV